MAAYHLSDPPRCPFQTCSPNASTVQPLALIENDAGTVIAAVCPKCHASFKPNGEVIREPARSCIRHR